MKYLFIVALFLFISQVVYSQDTPWTKELILPTKDLADKITKNSKDLPLILNVGPMDNIKGANKIGACSSPEGITKLKETLANTPKNKPIVIYCGCCSYDNCQNIRPAFKELQEEGFKYVKVLDIPEGFRENWVALGYPTE